MRIINTHAHWYPPEWIDLLDKEGANNGAIIGRNARGEVTFNKTGTQFRGIEEKVGRGTIVFRRDQIDIEQRLTCRRSGAVADDPDGVLGPPGIWSQIVTGVQ